MENVNKKQRIAPPKLIDSMAAGFNLVTSHLHLMLFPALLDMVLWLGPALKMQKAMEPGLVVLRQVLDNAPNQELAGMAEMTQSLWSGIFEQFNLFGVIRTFPIGVPSLLAGSSLSETPLGTVTVFEAPNFITAVLAILVIMLIGIFLGSLFFGQVAFISGGKNASRTPIWGGFVQSLLATVLVWLILMFITLPLSIMLTFLSALGMNVVQLAMIFGGLMLIWLLMPLAFSVHGIFTESFNAIRSALTSIRLIRFFLPSAGVFFLTAVILSQGMDIIWNMSPVNSWIFLVSILGHAFITSSLLAASFIYYRNGLKFMHDSIEKLSS